MAPSSHRIEHAVFGAILQQTRMPTVLCDPALPDCPVVYINPAFSDLTGYSADFTLGRNCRFMQGPLTDPASIRRIRDAVSEECGIEQEIYNYRRDGSGFWNALHITPIRRADGSLQYFSANQVDVSARKEAARRQAQRVESIGALASGVAHEFNNLMTVVLGSLERAARTAVDHTQKRHLERADRGAQRAGQLASELLSLARRKTHQDRGMDLNDLVPSLRERLHELVPDRIAWHLDPAPASLPVRLDPERLSRVVLNLVRNSVEAMPAGGEITIALRPLPAHEAEGALHGREAIELLVEDNGPGMQPDILERATELFFTTKATEKGNGLGLFVALDFVDKSGGKMIIHSAPEQGTRVRLILPRAS